MGCPSWADQAVVMVLGRQDSGSMILWLFVAVALFGALSWALAGSSRTSVGLIQGEAGKASATKQADCANSIAMAQKRLALRGCGASISDDPTGANPVVADGSCSIYHSNGGGVKPCAEAAAPPPADPCTTSVTSGAVCSDGAFYVGSISGTRVYAAATDTSAGIRWKTTATTTAGTFSANNGVTNTDLMATAGLAAHPAAQLCRALGAQWYLPSRLELQAIWTNRSDINLASKGIYTGSATSGYWSSTQHTLFPAPGNATAVIFNGTITVISSDTAKSNSHRVRCFRH